MTIKPYRIFAIGETLWDMLPNGKKVGGAPGNFAYHCRQLGANADVVSAVGEDELGRELLAFYRSVGLSTQSIVIDSQHPTGAVDVVLTEEKKAIYTFRSNVAWDHLHANEETLSALYRTDAICYGTLAGRGKESFEELKKMIAAVPKTALKVFDLNLRKPHYTKETVMEFLALSDVFKLNDEEVLIICDMLGWRHADVREQAKRLMDEYNFQLLMLTLGEQGSVLITANEISECHSVPVNVIDTVGAGDAFAAATLIGFLDGKTLDKINQNASDYAAYICTQPGGMPQIQTPFSF
ncbi:MAG: carbohydrate kinase [Planctomycetaceae bacterium]|jgi:fructokinase|nr:carbohydrate kinase [Planctomycetaceae bacterium]